MASVNKVTLIGNLGADPETRYMTNGTKVVTASIATTERWKNREGNKKERTEWHRVLFFRGLADVVESYLKEGKQVYVEGKLHTRKWEDKKNGVERYSTEIIASDMRMLGRKPAGEPDFSHQDYQEDDFRDDMER
jgi:single-strand DNA-binding protein